MANNFLLGVLLTVVFSVSMSSSEFTSYRDFENESQIFSYDDNQEQTRLRGCRLKVNKRNANKMKLMYDDFKPDFGRIKLIFNNSNVTSTDDVIQPFNWIWTFYDLNGLFSYTKWPYDFSILSFGLLDAKTVPLSRHYLQLDVVEDTNCSLTIGEKGFNNAIAYALKDFTQYYLLEKDKRVSFSYWCYLKTVPGVKKADEQASLYFNYPTEFYDYQCFHTYRNPYVNRTELWIGWKRGVTHKMFEIDFVPFIMSILAFAFFPILLLSFVDRLVSERPKKFLFYNMSTKEDNYESFGGHATDADGGDDVVYLNGNPPLSMLSILGGLCGLIEKYPFAVSRFYRFLIIILFPFIIYLRLIVYRYDKITYKTTMELLQHHSPMGYLSILAGFEESRKLFVPALGGPVVVLGAYHVLGLLFVFLPRDLMEIIDIGCRRKGSHAGISPLAYGAENLEVLSYVKICDQHGYAKAKRICTAGVYMLFSPMFWLAYMNLQYRRCFFLFELLPKHKFIAIVLCIVQLPFMVLIAAMEICLTLVLYGVPIVNFMYILVRGFLSSLLYQLVFSERRRIKAVEFIMKTYLAKFVLAIFLSCCFVYFIFAFCTIFMDIFMFLSKILVFCFISVIVYPSSSFGYLFFGIVFVYYVFKMFQKFGDGYFELLTDAIEVSSTLDNDPYRSHVIDGTVVIEHTHGCRIDKLQVHDTLVNLSQDQRQTLKNVCKNEHKKVIHKNNVAGIPKSLFNRLVKLYRPVHIEMANIFFKLVLIGALIFMTMRVVVVKPVATEGISEIMHVIFIMAIGALPKIIEVAIDNVYHAVKKDIQLRAMKLVIIEFWREHLDCNYFYGEEGHPT